MERQDIIKWIPLCTIGLVLFLDQLTKVLVIKNMELYETISVIGEYVQIRFILNQGMAFGIFADLDKSIKDVLFTTITVVSILIVVYYYSMVHKEHSWSRFYFALILGGAFGNLADKLFGHIIFRGEFKLFYGQVVDFIDIGIGSYRWATFNLADITISIGVFALIYIILFRKDQDIIHYKTIEE